MIQNTQNASRQDQERLAGLLKHKRAALTGDVQIIVPEDVRFILTVGGNTPLTELVKLKEFSENLYARAPIHIHLNPLCEVPLDVEPLANLYFEILRNKCMNGSAGRISPEALERLRSYSWPRNRQELADVIDLATSKLRRDPGDKGLLTDSHVRPFLSEGSQARRTLPPIAQRMPDRVIFVSYAREDEAAAAKLVHGLQTGGCKVWYDRERIEVGNNWENTLEDEVTKRCRYFLSVISATTESKAESYFIQERKWAAKRAGKVSDNAEFYIPVVIDDSPTPFRNEPREFRSIHVERLYGGVVTPAFVERMRRLQPDAF